MIESVDLTAICLSQGDIKVRISRLSADRSFENVPKRGRRKRERRDDRSSAKEEGKGTRRRKGKMEAVLAKRDLH